MFGKRRQPHGTSQAGAEQDHSSFAAVPAHAPEILDQVLDHADHHHFGHPRRTLGMYQPKLGALFFSNAPMVFEQFGPDFVRTSRKDQAHLNALKEKVIAAIAAYSRGDMDLATFRKKAVWQTL